MYQSLKVGQEILASLEGTLYFPPKKDVFKAFELTPKASLKVVMIGQDPYHNKEEAHGLAFSVKKDTKVPPSLKNIFKCLENDVGIIKKSSDLSSWARQGMLLLNKALTVKPGLPGSHLTVWEPFFNELMQELSHCDFLVWVLMGSQAKKIKSMIPSHHRIIETVHPSPLSAYRGFMDSKLFSKIQEALMNHGLNPIDFSLDD